MGCCSILQMSWVESQVTTWKLQPARQERRVLFSICFWTLQESQHSENYVCVLSVCRSQKYQSDQNIDLQKHWFSKKNSSRQQQSLIAGVTNIVPTRTSAPTRTTRGARKPVLRIELLY